MRTAIRVIGSLALVSVALVLLALMTRKPVEPLQTGWCCLRAGSECAQGYDALLCADSDGVMFSGDAGACSEACRTFPADAAAAPR